MAASLVSLLQGVEEKIGVLSSIGPQIFDKVQKLEEENALLKQEVEEKDKEIERLSTDIEYLTVSHKLAESPDSLIEARRMIARLIRRIDKCITMLNEEETR